MKSEGAVISADGTTIGYSRFGIGPGLVIVHGSMRSAEDYTKLAAHLADNFTVYVIDRRGRGRSGPQGPDYSFQKESEDVAAVLRKTGASFLFGHSFGGAVGLEAALMAVPLSRLAVYEPAVSVDHAISRESLEKVEDAVRGEQYGKALVTLFEIMGGGSTRLPAFLRFALSTPILARALLASPPGKRLQVLLRATLAEGRLTVDSDSTYERYEALAVETLFIRGADSPMWLLNATDRLARMIPRSTTIELDGIGHSGPCEDAPKQVAGILKAFFA